jgi:hypothetical protein
VILYNLFTVALISFATVSGGGQFEDILINLSCYVDNFGHPPGDEVRREAGVEV